MVALTFRLVLLESHFVSEDVGVGASAEHEQGQLGVILFPYHQPVAVGAADVALPFSGIFSNKFMWTVFLRQRAGFDKDLNRFFQHVKR